MKSLVYYSLAIVVFALTANVLEVSAQSNKEVLSVKAGEVFEIMHYGGVQNFQYSWVLSKDGELKKASQDKVFSARLSEVGNYVLVALATSTSEQIEIKRQFFLRVTEPSVPPGIQPEIVVYPTLNERKSLVYDDATQVIRIEPSSTEPSGYILDLNSLIDEDGDGLKNNDQFAGGTFFSTQGTPLHVWVSDQSIPYNVAVTSTQTSSVMQFNMMSAVDYAIITQKKGVISEYNPAIIITRYTTNQYGFSIDSSQQSWATEQVLLEWNFGDGTETLLDTPIHTFTSDQNTTQAISVKVRSLSSGKILEELKTKVELTALPITGTGTAISSASSENTSSTGEESSDSSSSSKSSVATTSKPGMFSGTFGLIIKVILVGFGSILAGMLIVMLIHFFKKLGGVQGIINKSEQRLVKPSESTSTSTVVDAMPLPAADDEEDTTQTKTYTPEVVPAENTPEQKKNVSNETAVPSWLKTEAAVMSDQTNTKSTSADATPASTAPLPSWLQTDTTPNTIASNTVAKEASTQTVDVSTKQSTSSSAVPSWLQTTPTEVDTPVRTQEVPSAATPVPSWLQTEQAAKTDTSTKSEAPLPSWLQTSASTAVEDTTTDSVKSAPNKTASETTPETKASTVATATEVPVLEGPVPSWLQTSTSVNEASVPTSTSNKKEAQVEPKKIEQTMNTDSEEVNEKEYEIDPAVWATMSEAERERERKRLKRKRYRSNKKEREIGQVDSVKQSTQERNTADTKTSANQVVTPEVQDEPIKVEASTSEEHDVAPAWLQTGLSQAQASGQTPTSTPSPVIKDIPLASADTTLPEPNDVEFIVKAESLNSDDTKKS